MNGTEEVELPKYTVGVLPFQGPVYSAQNTHFGMASKSHMGQHSNHNLSALVDFDWSTSLPLPRKIMPATLQLFLLLNMHYISNVYSS